MDVAEIGPDTVNSGVVVMVGVVVGLVDNKVLVYCEGVDDTAAICGSWLDDALPIPAKIIALAKTAKKILRGFVFILITLYNTILQNFTYFR